MVTDVDSPRLGGGSSSLFSSPTHHVVVDAASAIQSIRRSLSRSPSTPPTFRLIPSAAWSPSRPPPTDRRALSPSGVSRSRPPPPPPSSSSSPRVLSVPPSGGRAHRTSIRKIYTTRSVSRSRSSSSGDALRRPLSESKDHGNGASSARARPRRSQHRETRSLSPAEAMMKPPTDVTQPGSMNLTVPTITAATTTTAPDDRSLVRGYYGGAGSTLLAPVTVSPLKRTESVIDLDMIHDGSPLAKRRSLHAPSALAAELDRVDHRSPSPRLLLGGGGDGERPRPTELPPSTRSYHPWLTSTAGPPSSPVIVSTTTPDRASSLRRSTLQQRHHDRPGYGLARPSNSDRRLELADRAPSSRIRPSSHRVSLDGVWPSTLSESPFRSVGPLPSASVHPLAGGHQGGSSLTTRLASNQPHPLSQTVSQSSSASSVVDESPPYRSRGHAPRPRPLPPPIMDFSRSLPIGAMRPVGPKARPRPPPEGTTTSSTEVTYATPPNYRLVKPLPAAFMSTGLISKRNREPNQLPAAAAAAAKRALMPDTPCKRPAMTFQAVPFPTWPGRSGGGGVGGGGGGGGGGRSSSHDYGFPSTPLHSHRPRLSTGGGGGGLGIFGGKFVRRSLPRRSSFLSSDDGDDRPNSPGTETESLNTADFDLPPTPTKPGWSSGKAPRSDSAIVVGAEIDRHSIFAISKSVGGTSASPVGMTREVSNAPKLDWSGRLSPRTPQESMLPPDPSGLSISGRDHDDANNGFENERRRNSTSAFLPATPTTVRDHQPLSHQHFPSWTPRTGRGPQDLDATLRRRFGKVELIGTGEFSQVYRVTQTSRPDPSQPPSGSPFSTGSHGSIQAAEHVYAVKRSRRPYLGTRDRARKLQEVEVLKRLGQSDHTVHLIDSWEERDHLYIQTEFCEEGSLDLFLAQVGRKARLDDFRIWKIMLELCLGVKHIHDGGIIHLDLKPANVLITFEGVLKIGDFGMATSWPAPTGIEAEGDREYIGPEILMGMFDKPADIFALGLIMLEIAGNVELPDNGPSWQKLRAGDMSDVPGLTWSSASNVLRDSSGNPVSPRSVVLEAYEIGGDSGSDDNIVTVDMPGHTVGTPSKSNRTDVYRDGELRQPPTFMLDAQHEQALDRLVRWMISPSPPDRPVIEQLLNAVGVKWVEARRRAGATVFEGNWGPADDVLGEDSLMMDV